MFTLPAPYEVSPEARNVVKLDDLRQRVSSARTNLNLAVEQLDSLVAVLATTDAEASFAKTYTLSEAVGRNLAEVARLQARYTELSLEVMAIASSFEVTRGADMVHGLTPEQARANADRVIEQMTRRLAALGVSDVDIINRVLSHLAENEGGRGGVYCWDVRDPDGFLFNYVQAPAVEDNDG